jgi:hypothetical protein
MLSDQPRPPPSQTSADPPPAGLRYSLNPGESQCSPSKEQPRSRS